MKDLALHLADATGVPVVVPAGSEARAWIDSEGFLAPDAIPPSPLPGGPNLVIR